MTWPAALANAWNSKSGLAKSSMLVSNENLLATHWFSVHRELRAGRRVSREQQRGEGRCRPDQRIADGQILGRRRLRGL